MTGLNIPTTRAFLVLLLLFPSQLFGQHLESDEKREVRGRKAWLVATVIPDDLENPVTIMVGKDLTKVTLSKRSVGDPVKVPKDGLIRMVREITDPEDPSKTVFRTLAEARVPESVNQALVIFVPVKETESGVLFGTKVQDLAKFTGGETLYMNLSPRNIKVILGNDVIGLRSGDLKIHEVTGLEKAVNKAISYHQFDPVKKKWKLLSASTIVLRPTRREICIFSWDPRFDRIDYHGVTFPVEK